METVEAIVVDAPVSDSERIFGQLTENIQRDNMKLQDLIQSISQLIQNGFNQTEIAARLGKDRTYISRIAALASSKEEVLKLITDCAVNDAQTAGSEPAILADVPKRLKAVHDFMSLPEAESLAAANKRIENILKKNTLPLADAVDTYRTKSFRYQC